MPSAGNKRFKTRAAHKFEFEDMMLAPVSFVPSLGVVLAPGAQFFLSASQLQPKQQFAPKAKAKGRAPASETHRAGDWVCILCHNLNYSFRKVCNRCQVQTKRENLLQSLSLLGGRREDEPAPPEQAPARDFRLDAPPGLDAEDPDAEHFEQLHRTFQTPAASGKKSQHDLLSTQPGSALREEWNPRISPASLLADLASEQGPSRAGDLTHSPTRPFRLFHADKPHPPADPAIGGKPARITPKSPGLGAGHEEDASILRSVHSLLDEQ